MVKFVFVIIIEILLILGLVKDFKRDEGLHKKAKIYHAISLVILLYLVSDAYWFLGGLIRDFDKVIKNCSVDVGFVPGEIHLIINFLASAVSILMFTFINRMSNRNEKFRKYFMLLLPVKGILEVFSFYRGWLSDGENTINHFFILLFGLLFSGAFTYIVYRIYSSNFMKAFFLMEGLAQVEISTEESSEKPSE